MSVGRRRLVVLMAVVGCTPPFSEMMVSSTDASTTVVWTSTTASSTGDEATTSSTLSSSADSTSSNADDSSGVGTHFIIDPDGGGTIECDLWAQDCPRGEKCMPWANDGGGAWNSTRCSPLAEMPSGLGDPCTVEGSGVSGIDDCKLGAMCWHVDPETNMGECVGLCMGSEANPTCEDPAASCNIAGDSVLPLCLLSCDPLLQDCDDGETCVPFEDEFRCATDESGDGGAYGDPCELVNACDPGLFCANLELVPGCGGARCCSPFCDTSDPGASESCPGALGGQECVAWYEDGQALPGSENVGGCMVPA